MNSHFDFIEKRNKKQFQLYFILNLPLSFKVANPLSKSFKVAIDEFNIIVLKIKFLKLECEPKDFFSRRKT